MRRRHVLAASAIGAAGLAVGATAHLAAADTPAAQDCAELAFDMPSVAQLRAAEKKAFGFYFPPYPISHDNKAATADQWWKWLNPVESGQYKEYGGLVRDRPFPRAALGSDWQQKDFETEIRQAIDMGLDGFVWEHNPVTTDWHFHNFPKMLAAVAAVDPGFKIMLSPDLTNGGNPDPATVVQGILDFAGHQAIYKIDGVIPLATFYPERKSVDWWDGILAALDEAGVQAAMFPIWLDWSPDKAAWASRSVGFSEWGARFASHSPKYAAHAAETRQYDRQYMSPVIFEDTRPREWGFREASNSSLLRGSYEAAITGGADIACLMTWNDYAEAWMAPSVERGYTISDLVAYYTTWFKLGAAPKIVRDQLYYFHRSHHTDLAPTSQLQTRFMKILDGDAAKNEVEMVAFHASSATLRITQGSDVRTKQVTGSGMTSFKVPLVAGTTPKFALERSGAAVLSLTSATPIRTQTEFQDLMYHAGSTRQDGC